MFIGFFDPGYVPYHMLNSELEMLKIDHQKEMSDLKKFPKERRWLRRPTCISECLNEWDLRTWEGQLPTFAFELK